MFHSAGYFRGVSCPFFQHGLCHRPHCHYRHRTATPKPRPLLKKLPQLRRPVPTEQAITPKTQTTAKTKESKPKAEEKKAVQMEPVEPSKTKPKPEDDGSTHPQGETSSPGKESEPSTLVKHAIGAITNFYGSVSTEEGPSTQSQVNSGERVEEPDVIGTQERHPPITEGTVEIVSPPDISGEQIALTVAAEVPSYAPEVCIASQSKYSVEGSQEIAAPIPAVTDNAGVKVGETPPDVVMATERDIFGSPDEDVCDIDYDYDGIHESHGTLEEVKSEQELANIEAAFVKATATLQSQPEDGKSKAASRKRKSVDSDTSVKKKRLAHSTEPVIRDTVSLQYKPKVTSNFAAALDPGALYMGKKRTAVPSEQLPATKRPVLALTPNAKIPTKLRQRFLNSFIDEYLIVTADTKEAYEKALSEEQRLFDRSSRRMLYLNLSTIALKKLREEVKRVMQERKKRSDARVEAVHRGGTGVKSPGTPKSLGKKREGETEGKNRMERVEVAKKLKKRHKLQLRGGGEGSTKDVSGEPSKKVSGSDHGREKRRKNLPPSITSPPPSFQLDSPTVLEKCKQMELKLTRCERMSSCSSSSDEALFKTSRFYSPAEPKNQSLKSSAGRSSKKVASVVQSGKEEGRRADLKIKGSGVGTSYSSSLKSSAQVDRTSDGGQQRSRHGERSRSHSVVESDISVEESNLATELFGNSPESDHDVVWISSESDKEGMSFESALATVDSSTRKPVLKHRRRSHKEKTSSRTTGKSHKKLKMSSEASKSKSIQMPVSEQDDSVEVKSPTESKPLTSHIQAAKNCRASVYSSVDQVDTLGTGLPEKRHSDLRALKRKHTDSLEVTSPLGAKSPPLLSSPGAETPGPSYQPLPGPLINLTKLAAEHSSKKSLIPLSSRKQSRGATGSDRKTSRQIHSKPSQKPSFTIFKKKEVILTAPLFYSQMRAYILTEDQLVENGYPRPTAEEGVAMIHWREGEAPPEIQPVGPNAMRHCCSRCSKPFIIYNSGQYQTVEECVYHYGRLIKSREYGEGVVSLYTCCQERRDSVGCQVAKMHVTSGARPSRDSGYVQTLPPLPSKGGHQLAVYALDCEMCYTTAGLQLTRVSVVDMELRPVYESLVRPSHPIVDYNTRFSGLTAEHFVGVETTLEDVQQRLLHIVHTDTILLGHSLESDLRALKLVHSCVVDTAIVFPHRKGLPYKRALKSLMAEFLQRFIQDSADGGHDSLEDSCACMELMLWRVRSDLQKTTRRVSGER